jgi:hypothetical protein
MADHDDELDITPGADASELPASVPFGTLDRFGPKVGPHGRPLRKVATPEEHAERISFAASLLSSDKEGRANMASAILVKRYGVSRRQAQLYLKDACKKLEEWAGISKLEVRAWIIQMLTAEAQKPDANILAICDRLVRLFGLEEVDAQKAPSVNVSVNQQVALTSEERLNFVKRLRDALADQPEARSRIGELFGLQLPRPALPAPVGEVPPNAPGNG